jgi:hypothetical protein
MQKKKNCLENSPFFLILWQHHFSGSLSTLAGDHVNSAMMRTGGAGTDHLNSISED